MPTLPWFCCPASFFCAVNTTYFSVVCPTWWQRLSWPPNITKTSSNWLILIDSQQTNLFPYMTRSISVSIESSRSVWMSPKTRSVNISSASNNWKICRIWHHHRHRLLDQWARGVVVEQATPTSWHTITNCMPHWSFAFNTIKCWCDSVNIWTRCWVPWYLPNGFKLPRKFAI